ncbi:MAG: hypothetical protein AAFV86_12755, partial [Pseudomonadota bacterium]
GEYSYGVRATNDAEAGDPLSSIAITTGDVTTTGEDSIGIFADTAYGSVEVTAASVETTGENATGIEVFAGGQGDVSVTADAVETAGANANGVNAYAEAGSVLVETGDVTTTGDNTVGILAQNVGADATDSVTVLAGDVSSTSDKDVYALTDGGTIYVDIASGAVYALGTGVTVEAAGTDAIFVATGSYGVEGMVYAASTGPIVTTEDNSRGIVVYGGSPVEVVFTTIETAGAYAEGVLVTSAPETSTGLVSVTGESVTTTGEDAGGIEVSAYYGSIEVDVPVVSTAGDNAPAISAIVEEAADGSGLIVVTVGDVDTTGDASDGIYAYNADGGVEVTVAGPTEAVAAPGVTTAGTGSDAIYAYGTDTVSVTVEGGAEVATTGTGSNGIDVEGAGSVIRIEEGAAVSSAEGLAISGSGAVDDVTVNGALNNYSAFGAGDDLVVFNELGEDGTVASTTADVSGLQGLDGGANDTDEPGDVLQFNGVTDVSDAFDPVEGNDAFAVIPSGDIVNWENTYIQNGSLLSFGGNGVLGSDDTFVSTGSTLNVEDGDGTTGNLIIDDTSLVISNGASPSLTTFGGDLDIAGDFDMRDFRTFADDNGGRLRTQDPDAFAAGELVGIPGTEFVAGENGADDVSTFDGDLTADGATVFVDTEIGPDGVVASDSVLFQPGDEGGFLGEGSGTLTLDVAVTPVADPAGSDDVTVIGVAPTSTVEVELARDIVVDGQFFEPVLTDDFGIVLDQNGEVVPEVAGMVALAGAFQPINNQFFGDLGARIGTGDALYRPGLTGATAGLWGRLSTNYNRFDSGSDGVETRTESNNSFAQLGGDVYRVDLGGGSELVTSVLGMVGSFNGDVEQVNGGPGADISVESYGGGLGVTYYGFDQAFYVDATAMVLAHDGEVEGDDFSNMSFIVGLEGGTRIPIMDTISIVPSGRVVYSHTSDVDDGAELPNDGVENFVTGSTDIITDDLNNLQVTGGAVVEIGSGAGQTLQLGGELTYEALGEATTTFGSSGIETDNGGLKGTIMARGAADLGMVTIFGEIRGTRGLGNDAESREVGGSLGIRVDF